MSEVKQTAKQKAAAILKERRERLKKMESLLVEAFAQLETIEQAQAKAGACFADLEKLEMPVPEIAKLTGLKQAEINRMLKLATKDSQNSQEEKHN